MQPIITAVKLLCKYLETEDLQFQYFGAKEVSGRKNEPIDSGNDGNGNPVKLASGLVALTQAGEKGVDELMVLKGKLTKSEKTFDYILLWLVQNKKRQGNDGNGIKAEIKLGNSEVKVEIAKMQEMLKLYTEQFKLDPEKVLGVFDIFSDKHAPDDPELKMEELANTKYIVTRGEAFDDVAGPVFGPLMKRMRMENK